MNKDNKSVKQTNKQTNKQASKQPDNHSTSQPASQPASWGIRSQAKVGNTNSTSTITFPNKNRWVPNGSLFCGYPVWGWFKKGHQKPKLLRTRKKKETQFELPERTKKCTRQAPPPRAEALGSQANQKLPSLYHCCGKVPNGCGSKLTRRGKPQVLVHLFGAPRPAPTPSPGHRLRPSPRCHRARLRPGDHLRHEKPPRPERGV